jgi:hypothetical protein
MIQTQQPQLVLGTDAMIDLAPEIHRQRLVVEGRPPDIIGADAITHYLRDLSAVCDMHVLLDPVTHQSELYGWAGWVHWETSGAHFYAWDRPVRFFSVDIYTCKAFDALAVVDFTSEFFATTDVVAKAF